MTLLEIINQSCGEMKSSNELLKIGSLPVKNHENFCRYNLMKYFYSEDFEWDLHNCRVDYDTAIFAHLAPYLFFKHTPTGICLQLSGTELYD